MIPARTHPHMTRQKRNGTVYPAKIVTISAKSEGGLFGDGDAPMRMRFLPIAILLLGAFPPPSVAQSRVAQVAALLSVPVSDSSQGPVWQAFVDELPVPVRSVLFPHRMQVTRRVHARRQTRRTETHQGR